jgi:hypothetical protein
MNTPNATTSTSAIEHHDRVLHAMDSLRNHRTILSVVGPGGGRTPSDARRSLAYDSICFSMSTARRRDPMAELRVGGRRSYFDLEPVLIVAAALQ